ncbi:MULTISPECIES: hypothetical protein [unclassified Zunongwangia]|uniref:hypothetical protein n=1 Tax=unclassified Zunongwangia TaxID=2632541 RepID=UPI0022DD26A1|nr:MULTISPECIES: hypothetical protein [unclassified Zunongwangia]WBL22147.1 hypothetical protein PBT89_15715 [Zunongwangia sp. HRR-M8]WBL25906.1 hypothetical protein PBT91_01115 [Zunongwangia sp. HGR-M22]
MEEPEVLLIYSLSTSLFFFVIAVSFRLLDNSAFLMLKKEIFVDSSYVSNHSIKRHIVSHPEDKVFTGKLKRALFYRCLHKVFLILMATSLVVTIAALFLE